MVLAQDPSCGCKVSAGAEMGQDGALKILSLTQIRQEILSASKRVVCPRK